MKTKVEPVNMGIEIVIVIAMEPLPGFRRRCRMETIPQD